MTWIHYRACLVVLASACRFPCCLVGFLVALIPLCAGIQRVSLFVEGARHVENEGAGHLPVSSVPCLVDLVDGNV